MDALAAGDISEVEAAREVLSLGYGRMDDAVKAVREGKVEATSKEVTAIQSELRLAVRGYLETVSAQDEETEENPQAVEVRFYPTRTAAKADGPTEE